MKLDSKLFDRIRIKPSVDAMPKDSPFRCGWAGCDRAGTHKAPMGRGNEGKYHHFCIDHVRLYNKSYNYFAGMGDEQIAAYQKDSITGHRPTWAMGVNAAGEQRDNVRAHAARDWRADSEDPFGMFRGNRTAHEAAAPEPKRHLKTLEKKSFDTLELEGSESQTEIKARYKSLVKLYHPDANGGDRSSEDRLREIIQAYNFLKAAGFC